MLVLITQHRGFDVDSPLQLCEQHGREYAKTVGARWPEPHEHSASTKKDGSRWTFTIRVRPDETGDCDYCQPERELSAVEIEDVIVDVLQRARARM